MLSSCCPLLASPPANMTTHVEETASDRLLHYGVSGLITLAIVIRQVRAGQLLVNNNYCWKVGT
jgi:hypothetical protein